jgi:hypothetical protein
VTQRVLGPSGSKGRRTRLLVLTFLAAAFAICFAVGSAGGAANPNCTTANTLSTSNFEIDVNANLIVDDADCIDWLTGGTGTGFRTGVAKKNDTQSGANDESFGQGAKENTADPTVVTGSIPPNKSDLKVFGLFQETTALGKTLELFWSRINSPQGTTNMDFELNQKFCDPNATPTNCAGNGITPLRTIGDRLITYDLSNGGTVPTISIRTWTGLVWGPADVISGGSNPDAIGSVNTTTIPENQAGGAQPAGIGQQDPFTFGEAAIKFSALFPGGGQCSSFGSAYLKSRSSDSFQAELKDFIPPESVTVTNCTAVNTTLSANPITVGGSVHDSATLTGATSDAGGTVEYRYYSSQAACQADTNPPTGGTSAGTKTVTNGVVPDSDTVTFNSTGTFYWAAFYSGDANNLKAQSDCTTEVLVVSTAASAIATDQFVYPNDNATVSETVTGDISGNVEFRLFDTLTNCQSDDGTATAAGLLYSESVPLPAAASNSKTVGTSNKSVEVSADATVYWRVIYSGDAQHDGRISDCVENTVVDFTDDPGPGDPH